MNTGSPFDKDATTGMDVTGDGDEVAVDVDENTPATVVGETFEELEEAEDDADASGADEGK